MEGFVKIPQDMFELGLNPNEFFVLSHLLRIQSYREYKGEVEDGWFAKSQNELVKECGFGCHKRLTRILEGMGKKNILQINTTKTVTYFKITMGKIPVEEEQGMGKTPIDKNNGMGKIPVDTMGKMTEEGMGKIPNLHKNSNKNNQQEYTPDNFTPVEVPVNSNNNPVEQNMEIEEKKEIKEQNTIEQNKVTSNSNKRDYYIGCFEEGIGKGETPTFEQIAGFVLKNDISFTKEDFKINVYDAPLFKLDGKYGTNGRNLAYSGLNKLIPLKTEFGYTVSSDTQTIQDFMIRYVNKHKDLNIIVK